jgi:hypothetical protein
MARSFKLGDFLEMDGLPCVVVGLSGQSLNDYEISVPEDHIAVWFGDSKAVRKSEGGLGCLSTDIHTIPEDCFDKGPHIVIRH